MNLLPKSHKDFSHKEYWNNFFAKRGRNSFEWYGEYAELCDQIHKYIRTKDDVLIIGCGNSSLSSDLYDVGFLNITNIDISKVAIRQMIERNSIERPEMRYLHMDVMDMKFHDGEFSVVLDKGTLDALMPDDEEETLEKVDKMFGEIGRTLRVGGRYICITLLQEHILRKVIHYFPTHNWMFRVVRCHDVERMAALKGERIMPVFMIICTKFMNLPSQVLESCLAGHRMYRHPDAEDVISSVLAVQKSAMICTGLNKSSIVGQEEVCLELCKPGEEEPRFTIYVIDQEFKRENGVFAAFIVPEGRETEWLFSTKEGRQKLVKTAKFNRLAIVILQRNQKYVSLSTIKEELDTYILHLAPGNISRKLIPYISLGDDVGKRKIIYEGESELSGTFFVEDVTTDQNQTFRRLIFMDNRNIIQSEAKLRQVKEPGCSPELIPDRRYLACQHHKFMCIGVQNICSIPETNPNNKKNILLIGLGGGGLCTFLNYTLSNVHITAIEIDSEMVEVAEEFFGLETEHINLTVIIEDGLEYLKLIAGKDKYDAVLFDVDSKDPTLGLSCPPKSFLEPDVLKNVEDCLKPDGMFILNLVLRDETLKDSLITGIKTNFKSILSYKLDEDLNEVLYCKNTECDMNKLKEDIKISSDKLNEEMKKKKVQNDDLIDVDSFIDSLKTY